MIRQHPKPLFSVGLGEPATSGMARKTAAIQRYYADTKSDYDEFWTSPADLALHLGYSNGGDFDHTASLIRTNAELAALAKFCPGDRVLDAGCGLAGSSMWLSQQFGCHSYALNFSIDQLHQSEGHIQTGFVKSVYLCCGDYHCLPFPESIFAVVWALESIVHSYDRSRFFEEAFRVLRPRGYLLLSEMMLSDSIRFTPALRAKLRQFVHGWVVPSVVTLPQNIDLLAKANFRLQQASDVTARMWPSISRLRSIAQSLEEHARTEMQEGRWSAIRYNNLIASVALGDLMEYGALRYCMVSAET